MPRRRGLLRCPPRPPSYEYKHRRTDCESITGGAFLPGGSWPASYDDAYLFGDFVCNKIFELTPAAGGGFKAEVFAESPVNGGAIADGGPIVMTFGHHDTGEALYYTTFANGGEVRRIAHTGTG